MDISAALDEVRNLPPRGAIAREAARLRRDALDGSLTIAGGKLSRTELAALLDRGVTLGAHPLDDYLAARDLAAAAAWVADQRILRSDDPRPLLAVDDVRRIHTLAAAGIPGAEPGAWRLTVAVTAAGVVSPPPWTVPFELAGLVERVRRRPDPTAIPEWIAAFLTRFARIRPFAAANGRTARLAATLLLQRIDAPALAVPRVRAAEYRRAIGAALAGERAPLERLVTELLRAACDRLVAAGGDEPLLPLRALAGESYAALIKAAKRGRLRTVIRDGRVFSTATWVAAYRRSA